MLMNSWRRWLFALMFLLTASNYEFLRQSSRSAFFAAAQDKPFYTTPQFSNITHRTFVCDRFLSYANGTMDIRDLLQGLELSVGVVDQGNDIFLRLNRTDPDPNNWSIKQNHPGIFIQILDELAARGKFSWRKSFAYVQPPRTEEINPATGKNFTWTDVLLDSVIRYDFSFAEWVHSQERRRLGISFPVGWFDASTILVQNKVEQVSKFSAEAFLRPFSIDVWYLSCALIFFSGIVYWALDKIEFPDSKINTVVFDTFFATLTITQHHMYENPTSHAKRLFSFSIALWSLVLASAYTANLALYLVAERRPAILAESLEEVDGKRLPLCVRSGAAVYAQVSRTFESIDFRLLDDFDSVYETLRTGGCDLMASRKADFDAFKNDKLKNPDCSLEWVGRAQFVNTGGAATLVDTSNYCTSLIRHVLDVHMHDMIADGRIDFLWKTHLWNLENNHVCGGTALDFVQTLDGTYSLEVTDVGGVFVFHSAMILLSIIVTLFESPWRRNRQRKKDLRDAQETSVVEVDQQRPSMERLASCYGRPSIQRLSSAKALVYDYDLNGSFRSIRSEDDLYDSFRPIGSEADVLRSIQRMRTKIDRLHRHATRKMEGKKDNTIIPRVSKDAAPRLSVIPDMKEEEDPSEEMGDITLIGDFSTKKND